MEYLELYRQCPPRKVKDTNMTELEKCDSVLSIMTIAPILKFERDKMGSMRVIQVINDGVYV